METYVSWVHDAQHHRILLFQPALRVEGETRLIEGLAFSRWELDEVGIELFTPPERWDSPAVQQPLAEALFSLWGVVEDGTWERRGACDAHQYAVWQLRASVLADPMDVNEWLARQRSPSRWH